MLSFFLQVLRCICCHDGGDETDDRSQSHRRYGAYAALPCDPPKKTPSPSPYSVGSLDRLPAKPPPLPQAYATTAPLSPIIARSDPARAPPIKAASPDSVKASPLQAYATTATVSPILFKNDPARAPPIKSASPGSVKASPLSPSPTPAPSAPKTPHVDSWPRNASADSLKRQVSLAKNEPAPSPPVKSPSPNSLKASPLRFPSLTPSPSASKTPAAVAPSQSLPTLPKVSGNASIAEEAAWLKKPPVDSPNIKQRGRLSRFEIPEHLKELIDKDIVPPVLRKPLSPSSYAQYFAALLYAEDFYCEKWSKFLLRDVKLNLHSKEGFKIQKSAKNKKTAKDSQMDKYFVAFDIDTIPERRPYLLSRDHVLVRPSDKFIEPFQGILYRVVKSKTILAEFKEDFHKQHSPSKKYDVSFSFNRVCLKRSHNAVSAAMDPLLCSILFPNPSSRTCSSVNPGAIVSFILNLKGPMPYVIEGPPAEDPSGSLSVTGNMIEKAIRCIYTSTHCRSRILICAPRNQTCDAFISSLLDVYSKSMLFRANAAFRDLELVPGDVMPACLFEGECFTCPPLSELRDFAIVTSTFVSAFRLYAAGIPAGHFTHIFLVDASSSTEPETIVALANLVSDKTVIVVAGSKEYSPAWVRSDMARRNGLKKSFFHRLLEREPYCMDDPMFIAHIPHPPK